jgi:hypothetical protein
MVHIEDEQEPRSEPRSADAGVRAEGMVATRDMIQDRMERDGGSLVRVPLGTDQGADQPGLLPTKTLAEMCNACMTTFNRLYEKYPVPEGYDETKRAAWINQIKAAVVIEHPEIERSGFLGRYLALFTIFTNPDIPTEDRYKAMQTFLVKLKLERGEINGETATGLIADLAGLPKHKREEVARMMQQQTRTSASKK